MENNMDLIGRVSPRLADSPSKEIRDLAGENVKLIPVIMKNREDRVLVELMGNPQVYGVIPEKSISAKENVWEVFRKELETLQENVPTNAERQIVHPRRFRVYEPA